ncbi:MAG: helix-turn-helix domain-containing protein [Candidatus Binatota bacterium]
MPAKKYLVPLTAPETKQLEQLVRSGQHSARTLTRARVLLLAARGKTDVFIAEEFGLTKTTPRDIRQRYDEGGLDRALYDAHRPGQPSTLTTKQKAKITAIACTDPPDGYGRWTLDLLETEVASAVKKVGRTTIFRVLLASDLKPWREKNVVYQGD